MIRDIIEIIVGYITVVVLAVKLVICVIRGIITEKIIAPIVELATFGFIRYVRAEDEEE